MAADGASYPTESKPVAFLAAYCIQHTELAKNMKKQITVGVIGCGYWGPLLIRNFRSLPHCQLKAVCDQDSARVNHVCTLYSDLEGITSPQQLIAARDVNAVVIATPVKSHYSLAKASLLAGKHTFIEKPMATSSQEC